MIESYYMQLERLAADKGIPLGKAFTLAGVPNSTYYRMINRKRQSLRLEIAEKVAHVLAQLPVAVASPGH